MNRFIKLVCCFRSVLLLVVATLGFSLSAQAQVFHVRAGATGSNNGSDWNNAYSSMPTAFQRGATYYVADGSYGSSTFSTAASGTTLVTIKKATPTVHGSETGWSAAYGDGQATFASPLQFTSPYWLFDGVNWEGFVLTCNNIAGPCPSCGSMYISANGDFVTIKGVMFNANYAASFGHSVGLAGQDTTFDYCHFYKSTFEDVFGGDPDGTLTIRRCVIAMPNPPDDGAHRDIWNPYTGGGWSILFEKNIVYDIWLFGMLMQDSAAEGTITIRYNVFSQFGHATFRLGSGNGGTGNCTVYNNVFHNCLDLQIDSAKTTERNNIYSRTGGWLDTFGSSTVHAGANSSQYNLYTTGTSSFQSGTGNINGADVRFINTASPLGVDGIPFTADDGFNIQAGSAAISAGVSVGLTTDIRGNPVPSTPSVGAYQYGAASTNAAILVSPTSLGFGSVQTNTTRDLTLTVQNVGVGTLTGNASVAAPFSIVSGSAYSLGANQSQSVVVRYSSIVAGSSSQAVNFTGGGGTTVTVTGVATITSGNLSPVVSAITQNATDVDPNVSGIQIFEGTVVQYSGSATDPNGDALTWQWIYSVNGGAGIVHQSGSGIVSPASFSYGAGTAGNNYVWKLRVSDGLATAESQTTVGVTAPPTVGGGLSFEGEAGVISAPFVSSSGAISQSTTTDLAGGGRATYSFTVTNAGVYFIQAFVNAPSLTANSLYVNIDAEPADPNMAWDILPPTVGYENRLVSWRGIGTADANEFVPKMFTLGLGTHQLIIRGREANTQLDRFAILKVPSPPLNLRILGTQ